MKILDCTLRDGGYYTNWDFDTDLVVEYSMAMNKLPVEYIEIGYRGGNKKEYFGEFYYCPKRTIDLVKKHAPDKKIAIMLDSKNIEVHEIEDRLKDSQSLIDLVRIASAPDKIESTIKQAQRLKELGYKVAINLMYASKITKDSIIFDFMDELNKYSDYFYFVDSYGGMFPEEVKELILFTKDKLSVPLGFHGHNNLEMSLANSLAAYEAGATIIDSTITGMGRGAGNLKTELLLTTLKSKNILDFKYSDLSDITAEFTKMCKEYEWGSNYPYMITGAHSLPQAEVMSLLSKRRFSFDTILRYLLSSEDVKRSFPKLTEKNALFQKALIVGGGVSISRHRDAISILLEKNEDLGIVYSSSKSIGEFSSNKNHRLLCLQGNECGRFKKKSVDSDLVDYYIFPHNLALSDYSFSEIKEEKCLSVEFSDSNSKIKDSPLALAIETCMKMNIEEVYLVGFDGYSDSDVKSKAIHLETQDVINFYRNKVGSIHSLTATEYINIDYKPLYQCI